MLGGQSWGLEEATDSNSASQFQRDSVRHKRRLLLRSLQQPVARLDRPETAWREFGPDSCWKSTGKIQITQDKGPEYFCAGLARGYRNEDDRRERLGREEMPFRPSRQIMRKNATLPPFRWFNIATAICELPPSVELLNIEIWPGVIIIHTYLRAAVPPTRRFKLQYGGLTRGTRGKKGANWAIFLVTQVRQDTVDAYEPSTTEPLHMLEGMISFVNGKGLQCIVLSVHSTMGRPQPHRIFDSSRTLGFHTVRPLP
ncbi:hypothetical protein DFH06DRAFT_1137190 [Mycena polygramma]|nr:hypothetical protein DFH06DRAFT_1137190 [Mycena polygramma]